MSRVLGILVVVIAVAVGGWGFRRMEPCAAPIAEGSCARGCRSARRTAPLRAAGGRGPAARRRPRSALRLPRAANSSIGCSSPARSFRARRLQVAARIDGLSIVEIDAEDGDRVKAGQVLARLDRSQLDALLAENDAATKRADAAIEQAQERHRAGPGAGRNGRRATMAGRRNSPTA